MNPVYAILITLPLLQTPEHPQPQAPPWLTEWKDEGVTCCEVVLWQRAELIPHHSISRITGEERALLTLENESQPGTVGKRARVWSSPDFEKAWNSTNQSARDRLQKLGHAGKVVFDRFYVGGPFLGTSYHPPEIQGPTAFIWAYLRKSTDLWVLFALDQASGDLSYQGSIRVPPWPKAGRVELDPSGRFVGILAVDQPKGSVQVELTDLLNGEKKRIEWRTNLQFGKRLGTPITPEEAGLRFMNWSAAGDLLLMTTVPRWVFAEHQDIGAPPPPPPPGEGPWDRRSEWAWGRTPEPRITPKKASSRGRGR